MKQAKDLRIRDAIFQVVERDMKTNEKIKNVLSEKTHAILNPKWYTYDSIRIKSIEEEGPVVGDEPEYLIINGSKRLPWNADTKSKREILDKFYTDEDVVKEQCSNKSAQERDRIIEHIDELNAAASFLVAHIELRAFKEEA